MKDYLPIINALDWLDDIKHYEDFLLDGECTQEECDIIAQFIATARNKVELLRLLE